jgi:hypothetical protein
MPKPKSIYNKRKGVFFRANAIEELVLYNYTKENNISVSELLRESLRLYFSQIKYEDGTYYTIKKGKKPKDWTPDEGWHEKLKEQAKDQYSSPGKK